MFFGLFLYARMFHSLKFTESLARIKNLDDISVVNVFYIFNLYREGIRLVFVVVFGYLRF